VLSTNALFAEQANIITGVPLDMAGAPGLTTGWMSLKHYSRATIALLKAAGSGSEDPVITLEQATAVAGTGAKALTFTRLDRKNHATALSGIGTYTAVTQAAAGTATVEGSDQSLHLIDVRGDDLDVDNGFDCIRATVADVGTTAVYGVLFTILWGARYRPLISPLAD